MQGSANSPYAVSVSSDRAFLWRLCIAAWLVRFVIVVVYAMTGAIKRLDLSLDHLQYAREAINVMNAMSYGDFAYKSWVDDGWFQFVGLIYYLLWPSPFLVQIINITLGALTVVPLFLIVRQLTDDVRVQRFYAILVAFFPSMLFWSTLLLKDAAGILAVALIVYGVFKLRLRFDLWALAGIVAGLTIFIGTRTYLFMVLVMIMPAAFLLFPYRRNTVTIRSLILPALIGVLPMVIGYGYFSSGEFQRSMYFDIDYINYIRGSMGTGSGAMFAEGANTWGRGFWSDVWTALVTLVAVFIPVNPFDISSIRQLIALPFVFVMFYLAFPLVTGFREIWRARRLTAPIMVIGGVVLAVYVGGTSNTGALFRWTSQIMPYFLLAIALATFRKETSVLARFANRAVMGFSQPRRLALAY